MNAKFVKSERNGDKRKVTVQLGRKRHTYEVDAPELPPIRNASGWWLTQDGEWKSPVVERDGEWHPAPELWARDTSVDEADLLLPKVAALARREQRNAAAVAEFSQIGAGDTHEHEGLTLTFLAPVRQDAHGYVTAVVTATDESGIALNTSDGVFQFDDPPEGWNLLNALVTAIRNL